MPTILVKGISYRTTYQGCDWSFLFFYFFYKLKRLLEWIFLIGIACQAALCVCGQTNLKNYRVFHKLLYINDQIVMFQNFVAKIKKKI